MFGGKHIPLGGKRRQRRENFRGGMAVFKRGDYFALRMPAVEQRQQIAIQTAVEQCIESFGNEQRLLFADHVKAQVRSEYGVLDHTLVGRGGSPQDTGPGTLHFH